MSDSPYVSRKGVNYILSPKRGMCADVNPKVCQPLTAKGQANWTGSFISPDIDHIVRPRKIGGGTPTIIYMRNGAVYEYDGKHYRKLKDAEVV